MYLKKEINDDEFQITYARKGIFKEINNIPILVLYDGATITSKNNEITNFSFSKSDFSLSNLETNTTTYKKTQEISSFKLIKCLQRYFTLNENMFKGSYKQIENCSLQNINNILQEFYKRFVIPFYIPILSLIPFLLIISSKESSNYNRLRLITFIIGLLVIIFSETTIRFVSKITSQNIGLSLIPFLSVILLYLILFNKFKNKKT